MPAMAVAPEAPTLSTAGGVQLWVVRHAERIDETPAGPAWQQRHPREWFDPPLTDAGKQQAERMAQSVSRQLGKAPVVGAIFCSPLRRALQTAEPLSEALGLPIQVLPALGACTAACMKYGLAALPELPAADAAAGDVTPPRSSLRLLFSPSWTTERAALAAVEGGGSLFVGRKQRRRASMAASRDGLEQEQDTGDDGLSDLPLLLAAQRAALCPRASWAEDSEQPLESATAACERLCAAVAAAAKAEAVETGSSQPSPIVLVVGHRELMYDFHAREDVDSHGLPMRTPDYASVMKLQALSGVGAESQFRWFVLEMPKPLRR